jgi:2-dehydropantoate 2-reductase
MGMDVDIRRHDFGSLSPMRSIAVLGPGGVGGFLAAALARAGIDVTVVAREATAELIMRQGIAVRSVRLGDFTSHPGATPMLRRDVDALIVATKATRLVSSLERVESTPGLVVPLLNGLDHMTVLRQRFGSRRVAAGAIRIESDRPEPALIVQTSPFLRVDLAGDDDRQAPALRDLAELLQTATIPAEIGSSEAQILWSKLVRLNALACTTSACDCHIGFIRTDPEWRAALAGCIEEASAVAQADGADVDPAARLAELDEAHAELGSSMQRDIAAGREPELDAIAGAVLRAGRRYQLECPTIARLSTLVAQRAGIQPPSL